MIGRTLAHFRVTAQLGRGGMGEVWRAEDQKLGRAVALKLLPESLCGDAERVARFEREARTLAALNHPKIAAVYAFERAELDSGTVHFLVMELAEGETLQERIARGSLPVETALSIALQIATALEAAHERGIVHRDLKPANVKVGGEDEVKVLDFGLAKALSVATSADPEGATQPFSQNSPTISVHMTQAGMLLGTAAYMSPEQARGHAADKRSDIWAFGLVLMEMLTGRTVYAGDTVSDTLAAVLRAEPDWDALPAETPPAIRALLVRCLDKNAKSRLRDIGEARIAIERQLADPAAATRAPAESLPTAPSRRRVWLPWALTAAALVVAAGALVVALRPAPPGHLVQFSVRPAAGVVLLDQYHSLDISRDGRRLVFTGQDEAGVRRLYLRELDAAAAVALPGTEDGRDPFFSPDGTSIGFFTFSELKRMAVSGGAPIVLAAVQNPRGAAWVDDRTIVLPLATDGVMFAVSAAGGEPRPLTELDKTRNERTQRWPSPLHDGRTVLFTSDTFESTEYYDDARIEAVTTDGRRTVVLEGASMARFLAPGHLLLARGGALYAVRFDAAKLATIGEPEMVLQGVSTAVSSGAVHFAVSASGTLVHAPGQSEAEALSLGWALRGGAFEPLEVGQNNVLQQVTLSPDVRRAVVTASMGASADLWLVDLERSTWSRLTFAGNNWDPVWSPDGRRIAFAAVRDRNHYRPYWKAADGSGEDELLWDSAAPTFPSSFSPDGKLLAVEVRSSTSASDVWILPLDGSGDPYPFLDSPRIEWHPSFSPDGRWLAYSSAETGRQEVYVRAFPGPGGKWQLSIDGGNEPRWSPDGKRLYYRFADGVYEVDVETGAAFRAGNPRLVLDEGSLSPFNHMYDMTPDGSRFLVLRRLDADSRDNEIVVSLNWTHELLRRVSPR